MLGYIEIEKDHIGFENKTYLFEGSETDFIDHLRKNNFKIYSIFSNVVNCEGGITYFYFNISKENYIGLKMKKMKEIFNYELLKNKFEITLDNFKIKCNAEKDEYFFEEIKCKSLKELREFYQSKLEEKYNESSR